MNAYTNDDFEEFDRRVIALLRRGLAKRIARKLLAPSAIARVRPRWARRFSRTTVLASVLSDDIFGDTTVASVRRSDLEVIINTTELRTGTAFRFGSSSCGSSRFGTLAGERPSLAFAVAASAAYPVMLPPLDVDLPFKGRDGSTSKQRLLLTDGGVYDNLGTACMEPGRTETASEHVFRPDYIVACDAGVGVVDGVAMPYSWVSRMRSSFETLFRRVQNGSRNRLHAHAASGKLSGFVMPYLGQQDARLPWAPPDLIRREKVVEYPTDFSAMSDENIRLLAGRGQQLTRLLISHHCPEI